MTPADTTALVILGAFAAVATLGGVRWLVRCLLGLAVGCAVLVALSHFADAPPPADIGRFISDSRIVQTITDHLPITPSNPPADSEPSR